MEALWAALGGLAVGALAVWSISARQLGELRERLARRSLDSARSDELLDSAREDAEQLLEKAREDAEELLDEARAGAERLLGEAAEKARAAAQAQQREAEAARLAAELEAREIAQRARLEAAALTSQARADAEAEARAQGERLRATDDERRRADEARRAADEERRQLEEARWRADEARASKREAALLDKEHAAAERERALAERDASAARKEREQIERDRAVVAREGEAIQLVSEQRARLEALAGMTGEEARRALLEQLADDARRQGAREGKLIEDAARDEAEKRAKRIVGIAIQRYAGDHVQERAVSSVHLSSDELKGRIIGREGRNIRALQEATGVDFIVDDTPETIVISSFDPVRREVARAALERLVSDGRIHPSRIEEVVAKARDEVERQMGEAAEQAMDELGVTRLHPELGRLVGQLRYRYSYAQNVLKHSVECGYVTGLMAGELGLNVRVARRAGLLHDIGKAVSHEVEGGHAMVGGRLARKHGEDEVVANAIACHHDDEPCSSVYGHLVTAADALSGARPGARRERLESYVKRLGELERIATAFVGVERSYAIQAGREVRVMVEPGEVSDEEAALLAREISRKIEEELVYPGQIRVTVVRETRAIDYAK
jgi:ribonucrease Y